MQPQQMLLSQAGNWTVLSVTPRINPVILCSRFDRNYQYEYVASARLGRTPTYQEQYVFVYRSAGLYLSFLTDYCSYFSFFSLILSCCFLFFLFWVSHRALWAFYVVMEEQSNLN